VVSKGPDRVQLPGKLKGLTVDEAKAALAKVDLVLGDTKPVYDEKVDKGRVIKATNVTADDQLRRGTEVVLAVSKGRKPIRVEDYTGRPVADARTGLEGAGFTVEVRETFSQDVDKGVVISQDPDSGTKFKDDTITLTVSKGPEIVRVPNVIGKKRNQATKILEKAGFTVQALGTGNFTVRASNPGRGSRREKGSTVTITFIPF
jgi:beta-lactam-binding protein with PASTA domain